MMHIDNSVTSTSSIWPSSTARGTSTATRKAEDATEVPADQTVLSHATLLLPTKENVDRFSASLASDMKAAFEEWGIPTNPPVQLTSDPATGRIKVSGDRADTAVIEERLNADGDLAQEAHTTIALTSQMEGMEESMRFQEEYRASDDPQAVIAKYSYLLNGWTKQTDTVLTFNGKAISAG